MYEVIKAFADGENGMLLKDGRTYAVGNKYPADGFEPSKEHIGYLQRNGFIVATKQPKPEAKKNDEGRE